MSGNLRFSITTDDPQIRDYLEELVNFLQGQLMLIDQENPGIHPYERWERMLESNIEFLEYQYPDPEESEPKDNNVGEEAGSSGPPIKKTKE